MAELRWILLLAGLVFLAVLAAWELRRPRQARRDALSPQDRSEPAVSETPSADTQSSVPMPSIPMRSHFNNARVPLMTPTRVDIPPLDPQDLPEPQVAASHSIDFVIEAEEPAPVEESMVAVRGSDAPLPDIAVHAQDIRHAEGLPAQVPLEQPLPAAVPTTPVVEWPPESQRHILSVRVVGISPDRLSGRPLRQALAACGFVHGRFGIFHQPGADGRALISAANLSKPGVFDPGSMDFQRFRGLGLFAVLPGPLPPAAALDHLIDTAGDLAQRLQARLMDETGQPLDEERLEAMAKLVHGMSQSALRSEPAA